MVKELGVALGVLSLFGGAAAAQERAPAATWDLSYTADVMGPVSGGVSRRGHFADLFDVVGTFDLERLAHWRGWSGSLFFDNTSGGDPNDAVGSLQGIDNIAVARQRLRLYEAWLEKAWDGGSLRVGLYNLNSEFYATDSAGVLLGPSFGIGPELAATGANGPSIFPSTALAARFNVQFGETGYARFAILNADAGVPGDPGGVDARFNDGVLLIGEGGLNGLSLGAWTYSDPQPDIREPETHAAHGAYVMAERPLNDPDGVRAVRGFARVGVSDGETSPFAASWQAGVLMERVFASRPDSVLSFGVAEAFLSDGYRANQRDLGAGTASAETQFEITYSDQLSSRLSVQPDIQYLVHPGGDRDVKDALVAGLRMTLTL